MSGFLILVYICRSWIPFFEKPVESIFKDGGILSTNDPDDRISIKVEQNAVASDTIEFVLKASPTVTWRKEIVIKEGASAGTGAWTIFTQDSKREDKNGLYSYQLNGGSLTFRKAKEWGIMRDVQTLSLDTAIPGSVVTFTWDKDD